MESRYPGRFRGNSIWVVPFFCTLLCVHSSSISLRDHDSHIFVDQIQLEVTFDADGANVTWYSPSSLLDRRIYLVEFRELNSVLKNASYVKMLSETNSKYIYNLRADTGYVICVHLGRESGDRLIDKNCCLGETLKRRVRSPFMSQPIFAVIVGVSALTAGFVAGFAVKVVCKKRKKASDPEIPDIPPRPPWTLPDASGTNRLSTEGDYSLGDSSYVTILDSNIQDNRRKSRFTKNQNAQIVPQLKTAKNCRSLSLPSIQKAHLAKALNNDLDFYATVDVDYGSVHSPSLASYSSLAVPGLTNIPGVTGLVSFREVGLDETANANKSNTQSERL